MRDYRPAMTSIQMGQRIGRLRKRKGWSQYGLAREAGISREHIRRLEAGVSDPTLGMLTKLARALGVKLVDLVQDIGRHGRTREGRPVQH